jgi:hypothetical protein
VTIVQGTHGRNEGDLQPGATRQVAFFINGRGEFGGGYNGLH